MSLYRDAAAREHIHCLYWQQVRRLPQSVVPRRIDTPYGSTQLWLAGDPRRPPLLALPGLQTGGGFNLELLWPLTADFLIISPDVPGQAGLSAEQVPDRRRGGYGRWALALLDALGIERCAMVGVSFGGAVLLDLARQAPERIERASLIVPAGLRLNPWRALKATFRPWLGYRLHRDDMHFAALMNTLMADPWPALGEFYRALFENMHPVMRLPPGPFGNGALRSFRAPVQLVLARRDLYFEPVALERAARRALPNLVDVVRLDDTHIPGREGRRAMEPRLRAFLGR